MVEVFFVVKVSSVKG